MDLIVTVTRCRPGPQERGSPVVQIDPNVRNVALPRPVQGVASFRMGVFGTMRSLDVRSLAGPVVEVNASSGTCVVREGVAIGTFFVIRSGSAELRLDGELVGSLGPGDCFGEVDPTSGVPQPLSVVAGSDMRLLTFSSIGIDRLCAAIPYTRERILDSLPTPPLLQPASSTT
jgi:CRP-like cAMP-binding protein